MATFNNTISESLGVFGPSTPNLWGTMEWGQNWGEGDFDVAVTVLKTFSETSTLADSTTKTPNKIIGETQTLAEDTDQTRSDPGGYFRLFGNKKFGDNRVATGWTEASDATTTWTTAAANSTTWSKQ